MLFKNLFKKEHCYLFSYDVVVENRLIEGQTIYKLPARNESKIDLGFIRNDIAQEIEKRNNKKVDCVIIKDFKKLIGDWGYGA